MVPHKQRSAVTKDFGGKDQLYGALEEAKWKQGRWAQRRGIPLEGQPVLFSRVR